MHTLHTHNTVEEYLLPGSMSVSNTNRISRKLYNEEASFYNQQEFLNIIPIPLADSDIFLIFFYFI